MNEKAKQLYAQLHHDIALYKSKGLSCIKTIEGCFRIAESYLKVVRDQLLEYEFESQDKEIAFFKEIQPRFRAFTYYYGYVYHTFVFCERSIIEQQEEFWQRERKRLGKFIKDNRVFYDYYKSGSTYNDVQWFTAIVAEAANQYEPMAEPITSSHGGLVAILLALERYDGYIKMKSICRQSIRGGE